MRRRMRIGKAFMSRYRSSDRLARTRNSHVLVAPSTYLL